MTIRCNLCGSKEFTELLGRSNLCAGCGSAPRTRLLWLYLADAAIGRSAKILHLAPEKGLYDRLSAMVDAGNYVTADIEPSRYGFAADCMKLDLCDLEAQPSFEYDFIIHSHVMEHVPCNIAYCLYHLHRMLKPDGMHICIIPFMSGKHDESFQDIGRDEKIRRFGQYDHVRRFGKDDRAAHLGKLINLPDEFNARTRFTEEQLRDANVPEIYWTGFHIGTVLTLNRSDMKFISQGELDR